MDIPWTEVRVGDVIQVRLVGRWLLLAGVPGAGWLQAAVCQLRVQPDTLHPL